MWVQKDQANLQQCQAPNVQSCQWHSRIQWEPSLAQNSAALSCSVCSRSSWHLVQEEWGKPGVEVDRTCAKSQNHLWSRYKAAWLRSKGKNGRAQGKVSLHLLGVRNKPHTEQASVWTVCFWCHGNLQKELHNSTTFLEGLHELKYCYTMTTSPKIGSSSTRSSTNAILKWLKLSPQNCKQAAPSTRNTDLFNIPPV